MDRGGRGGARLGLHLAAGGGGDLHAAKVRIAPGDELGALLGGVYFTVGTVISGAVEQSNADISKNLISLITASTQYRGNARVITAAAAIHAGVLQPGVTPAEIAKSYDYSYTYCSFAHRFFSHW